MHLLPPKGAILGLVAVLAAMDFTLPPNAHAQDTKQKPTLTKEILANAVTHTKARSEADKQARTKALAEGKGVMPTQVGMLIGSLENRRSSVEPDAVHDLMAYFEDNDPEVRLLGAVGLRMLKDPACKPVLVNHLKGLDVPKLREMVKVGTLDPEQYMNAFRVWVNAILTLGKIGDKDDIPFLESLRGQ